jgi:hypothetical protein
MTSAVGDAVVLVRTDVVGPASTGERLAPVGTGDEEKVSRGTSAGIEMPVITMANKTIGLLTT